MLILTKNKLLALCLLNFCAITFTPLAHAVEKSHSGTSRHTSHPVHKAHKPRQPAKNKQKSHHHNSTTAAKKTPSHPPHAHKNPRAQASYTASASSPWHDHPSQPSPGGGKKSRVHQAKKTAISKLMKQLGKPYHWGGTSPGTGFDCSGLVYFAYKDLVNFHIPRTANAMYHLRDAAPVPRSDLKTGDLVFFRTEGRATADHVGVYLGNGKFIQSPRTGENVQIVSMDEHYWQHHYVGARRIVTPKTVR